MQLFVLNTRSFRPMKYDWDSLTYEGDGLEVDKLRERVKLLKIAVASNWAGCTNKALWSIIFQFSGHEKNEYDRRTLFQSLKHGIYLQKTPWIEAGRVCLNVDTEAWERRQAFVCNFSALTQKFDLQCNTDACIFLLNPCAISEEGNNHERDDI